MTLRSKTSTPSPPPLPPQLETQLTESILLTDRVRKLAGESTSFKLDCIRLVRELDNLSTQLRTLLRFTTTTTTVYHHPIRRITMQVFTTLHHANTLVRKCRHASTGFFYRLANVITTADFRTLASLLEASTADLRWLNSIFCNDHVFSLPPIAGNDPILAWVWSLTATIQMSMSLAARIEAANELALLGKDSDRNKRIIVEEGGVPPLLKLLKERTSIDSQVAAVGALLEIGSIDVGIKVIVDNMGVPLLIFVLGDSSMRVQAKVSELVARMTELDDDDYTGFVKEEFGKENVIHPLVSLLSFESFRVEFEFKQKGCIVGKKESKKEMLYSSRYSCSSLFSDVGSAKGGSLSRKSSENESPEVKLELKINCAKALWMLVKGSVENARRISETKGLLCLAKLIENESEVLQRNCVMAIMEIALAAEANTDLRRSVFKTSSPAAKAVVEQLLRVIKESDDLGMKIAAIRSIGCLCRMFPARETRVIGPLVEQLENNDSEVATQAVLALGKFADPDNFLCIEHSKTIIEFAVVIPLLKLLRASQKAQINGLVLLCYLAINASNSEGLEQPRVLATLRGVNNAIILQNPQLKELIVKAVYRLDLYLGKSSPS